MSSHSPLKDKVVVIAGGAKNLGGLLSRRFAEAGAKGVCVHYNSDATEAAARETVEAVRHAGGEAFMIQGDLTRPDAIAALFEATEKNLGRPDIAVNTVGMVLKKPFAEISEAEYDTMFAVNSKSAFFFIQEAGKRLNDGGKIITLATSLLGAFTGLYSSYAGAKAPVEHFTRAAAKEFGARKISVNAVAPGPMDTPFFYGQESTEAVAYHSGASALGGLTDIADIAPLITFLAGEGWWITGQTILANGGYTTK